MNKLPKGCYCNECLFAEEAAGEEGEPIYICHFQPDALLTWMEPDDFCSLGIIGEYQEVEIEYDEEDDECENDF